MLSAEISVLVHTWVKAFLKLHMNIFSKDVSIYLVHWKWKVLKISLEIVWLKEKKNTNIKKHVAGLSKKHEVQIWFKGPFMMEKSPIL